MKGPESLRRALVPLLAAAVMVQGVLGLVPHQHHSCGLPGAAPTATPSSSPVGPQFVPTIGDHPPDTFCLACAITPSAFSRSQQAPTLTCDSSFGATAPPAWEVACLPRPWRCLQRGPPPVA